MPVSYEDILAQVFTEIGDFERNSVTLEFQRSLSEVCLCILLLTAKPTVEVAEIQWASQTIIDLFDVIPVTDIYQGSNVQHALPQMMVPVNFRNLDGSQLSEGSMDAFKFYSDAWSRQQDTPQSYYRISNNLFGIRPAPTFDTLVNLTYVPYMEVVNLEDLFPLDNQFIQPFTQLQRYFLFARLDRWSLANEELKRFMEFLI